MNWTRIMGVTTAPGPAGDLRLGSLVSTTQAMPSRTGTLGPAVGARVGMALPGARPMAGASGGGPQAGTGLASLTSASVIPQAERLQAPRRLYQPVIPDPPINLVAVSISALMA